MLTGHANGEVPGSAGAALTGLLTLAEPVLDADDDRGPADIPVPRKYGGHGECG